MISPIRAQNVAYRQRNLASDVTAIAEHINPMLIGHNKGGGAYVQSTSAAAANWIPIARITWLTVDLVFVFLFFLFFLPDREAAPNTQGRGRSVAIRDGNPGKRMRRLQSLRLGPAYSPD